MGLFRNLRTDEIVGQYLLVLEWAQKNASKYPQLLDRSSKGAEILPLSNVVYMGMGEPLDNVEAVSESIAIFLDPLGLALAQRRVTVSTSGQIKGLGELLERFPQISLALSLHAATDNLRSKLMPINDVWNLADIRNKIIEIEKFRPSREILVQYTLIKGVNDSAENIRCLAEYLDGLQVKLNVIPFNEFEGSLFKRPSEQELWSFVNAFSNLSPIRPLVRFSKAKDIGGACGQLVTAEGRKKPAVGQVYL
jgi:23S rRNA (adenine2503-C2)-methyltransferase